LPSLVAAVRRLAEGLLLALVLQQAHKHRQTNKSKAPITTRENVGFLSIAFSSFPLRNLVKTGFY